MKSNNNDAIVSMKLNGQNHSDNTFNQSIKFVVEKYIGDEVPEQIQCKDLHEAIIQAYKLFLNNELHSIGLYDRNRNYNGTDALNYFVVPNVKDLYSNISMLEEKIKEYKEFIELTKNEELFKEFLEYKKNKSLKTSII